MLLHEKTASATKGRMSGQSVASSIVV
jgi:hypothetical protein